MSNGEVRKVSLQDIQLVQNLIERCLQLYMSQREVVSILFHQAKIEPSFTELVWQRLEEENKEFFRAYHLRLILKDQILRFNQLLERQVKLMCQMSLSGVVSAPLPNGSQNHSMHNSSAYQDPKSAVPYIKSENMHQMISALPNVYTNGTSLQQQHKQVAANMAFHAGRVEVPASLSLPLSSNAGVMQGFHGGVKKTEGGYAGDSLILFGADNNPLEPRTIIREPSISYFTGGESCSQTINETVFEPETNSYGHMVQKAQDFSLLDLTCDFPNSTDILEIYSRYPFLGVEASFLDPHIREEEQDINRLDNILDGFSCEGFGSE